MPLRANDHVYWTFRTPMVGAIAAPSAGPTAILRVNGVEYNIAGAGLSFTFTNHATGEYTVDIQIPKDLDGDDSVEIVVRYTVGGNVELQNFRVEMDRNVIAAGLVISGANSVTRVYTAIGFPGVDDTHKFRTLLWGGTKRTIKASRLAVGGMYFDLYTALPSIPGVGTHVTIMDLSGSEVDVMEINGLPAVPVDPDDLPAGTGTGDTPIDHDGGTGVTVDGSPAATDILRFTASGVGIDNVEIIAYLKSDYDAGNGGPAFRKGATFTGTDGRWEQPLMLDDGTYTLVANVPGYQAKTHTVVVP